MSKPLLSIGMIFKNEIRCLERCMKSLAPLRAALSCELVMADTGSTDGSRAIAAKYADILFDFPWINDFSAARNAVMDRCSGRWHLFIDCDEWLDEDISQLVAFMKRSDLNRWAAGAVVVRSYRSYDPEEWDFYADGMPVRLLRVNTGLRFEGVIHESWVLTKEHKIAGLNKVIFHHDGYALVNGQANQAKRDRNLPLLRKTLQEMPDDLRSLKEYIDSSGGEPDHIEYIRHALELVEAKHTGWERQGPPLFRNAVFCGREKDLPETDEWIRRAEEIFPDELVVQLDIGHIAFGRAVERGDWGECVRRGERWLAALEAYQSGKGSRIGTLFSTLQSTNPKCAAYVRIFTANAYLKEGQFDQALRVLETIDGRQLEAEYAGNFAVILQRLHAKTNLDTGPLMLRFWEQVNEPGRKRAEECRKAFLKNAAKAFRPEYLEQEERGGFLRRAYTAYLPLSTSCQLGIAAAILGTDSQEELKELFGRVEDWSNMPAPVVEHAMLSGAGLPALTLEEMDGFVGKLTWDTLARLAAAPDCGTMGALMWSRALVLAAVQIYDWKDSSLGMALCRAFADVERAFLPMYYAAGLLCEENIRLLPPMHRFGWYCAQAFAGLDAGDTHRYVQLLQKGLAAHPGMKAMVKFLTEYTPQLQPSEPSGELLSLAGQVRVMLSAYAPDDPAVTALKASPVYRKVAHLIEGPDLGLAGGLAQ